MQLVNYGWWTVNLTSKNRYYRSIWLAGKDHILMMFTKFQLPNIFFSISKVSFPGLHIKQKLASKLSVSDQWCFTGTRRWYWKQNANRMREVILRNCQSRIDWKEILWNRFIFDIKLKEFWPDFDQISTSIHHFDQKFTKIGRLISMNEFAWTKIRVYFDVDSE